MEGLRSKGRILPVMTSRRADSSNRGVSFSSTLRRHTCDALSLPAAVQVSWYGGLAAGQSRTDRELVDNRESTLVFAQDVHTDFDAKDSA